MNASVVADWVDEHGGALLSFAASRVFCQNTAEDLVQETFLAAVQTIDRGQPIDQPRAWLMTTLRCRIVDHFRRMRHRRSESIHPPRERDADDGTSANRHPPAGWMVQAAAENDLAFDEFQREMLRCADQLSPRMSQAFMVRVVSGLSVEESAELVGVSASTLAAHLYRARLSVRDCLAKKDLL